MNDYIRPEILDTRELKEMIQQAKREFKSAEQRWISTSSELEKRSQSDDFDFMRSLSEELFLLDYELEELEQEIETLSNILNSRKVKSQSLSSANPSAIEDVIELKLSEKLLGG